MAHLAQVHLNSATATALTPWGFGFVLIPGMAMVASPCCLEPLRGQAPIKCKKCYEPVEIPPQRLPNWLKISKLSEAIAGFIGPAHADPLTAIVLGLEAEEEVLALLDRLMAGEGATGEVEPEWEAALEFLASKGPMPDLPGL